MAHVEDHLGEAIDQLAAAMALSDITRIVREAARELTGADGVTFVLRDGDLCHYADESAIRPLWKGKRFPMAQCVSGWVMQHNEPVVLADVYADERVLHSAYRPTFVKSLAIVPVKHAEACAAIGAYWATPHHATEHEVRILEVLAEASARAMARLH
jgi:GAF domain-containing protein